MITIVLNLIRPTIRLWVVFAPESFSYEVSVFEDFIRHLYANCFHLIFLEYCVLKYLIEFAWKRIPPLNHDFTVFWLYLSTIASSFLISVVEIALSIWMDTSVFEKMAGRDRYDKHAEIYNSRQVIYKIYTHNNYISYK